ncbi:MAG: FecR domain-containing protein [Deltaproteobacteria bacterium]|nr:FecR domain-containing protein [Deltaproteobacteria bacterium]
MGIGIFGFLVLASISAVASDSAGVGKLTKIEGAPGVKIVSGNGSVREVEKNGPIFEHDKIVTRTTQTVTLVFRENSEIVLAPESEFVIEKYLATRTQTTILHLAYGLMRSLVNKVYSENEAFVVETSNAAMGVRGTNFLVEADRQSGKTILTTLRGTVAIAQNMQALKDPTRTTLVSAGQKCSMQNGMKNATPPASYDKTQLHEHLQKASPNFENNLGPESRGLDEVLRRNGGNGGNDLSRRFDRPASYGNRQGYGAAAGTIPSAGSISRTGTATTTTGTATATTGSTTTITGSTTTTTGSTTKLPVGTTQPKILSR